MFVQLSCLCRWCARIRFLWRGVNQILRVLFPSSSLSFFTQMHVINLSVYIDASCIHNAFFCVHRLISFLLLLFLCLVVYVFSLLLLLFCFFVFAVLRALVDKHPGMYVWREGFVHTVQQLLADAGIVANTPPTETSLNRKMPFFFYTFSLLFLSCFLDSFLSCFAVLRSSFLSR